jgi:hypothetical protein
MLLVKVSPSHERINQREEAAVKTTRLTGVRGMWYVESTNPEFGPMPTISVASIAASEGFGRRTKLSFNSPSQASLKKAHKAFGGKNYWEAIAVAHYVALVLNNDEDGGPHSYLGVFPVSGYKGDEGTTAYITIQKQVAVHEE